MHIRRAQATDILQILAIINDAARAYRGVIPADRWREPYMRADELTDAIEMWVAEKDGHVVGVIGLEDKEAVTLVRHAYVSNAAQRQGVGSTLLHHVEALTDKPILIGTWAAASWAIDFYVRNGYVLVDETTKNELLRAYWTIPERQIETSVVLADRRFRQKL